MKINYVNRDHVHALVDLPTNLLIEEMMHLFKGSSSHWGGHGLRRLKLFQQFVLLALRPGERHDTPKRFEETVKAVGNLLASMPDTRLEAGC